MKRAFLFFALALSACSAKDAIAPTITPLAPAAETSPPKDSAPAAKESALPVEGEAKRFPNAEGYEWRKILDGLTRPVAIESAQGKLFIIEKQGKIRVFENGRLQDAPFLDVRDRVSEDGNEMGLLGLAFHPQFEQNGFFYVNYTGAGGNTRIARFHADGNFADPASEKILLIIEQPYENHNGGALAFGPGGYLYAGLGDGGLAGDPHKNGQNKKSLLGKILRLDVNNGDPYTIPADNPFGNEVWAYGLRNPWRFSFDRARGDLWIGDVGQGDWEEVDYLPAGSPPGANFGWSVMEGAHGYDGKPQPDMILPAAEYSHNEGGCAVTGGYVYRGEMSEWNGVYLYGDYCSGEVWGLLSQNGVWKNERLFRTGALITTFGQDAQGGIYFASDNGSIYQLTKK
ncbi:MAG: PQQ-dependent sugar dehydrogenase [Anaerolineales bacterium]